MIRPIHVDKQSPFLGEECALCKQLLGPGDELVICPEDATRHHAQCWQANGNKCTAYGCMGQGELVGAGPRAAAQRPSTENDGRSKVRVLPSSSLGCAQNCLYLSIAVSILLFAISCFGLWAIADYIMMEVLGWQYRQPLSGAIFLPGLVTETRGLVAWAMFLV